MGEAASRIEVAYEANLLPWQSYRVTWNDDGTCRLWSGDREVFLPHTQAWLAALQKARHQASDEDDAAWMG